MVVSETDRRQRSESIVHKYDRIHEWIIILQLIILNEVLNIVHLRILLEVVLVNRQLDAPNQVADDPPEDAHEVADDHDDQDESHDSHDVADHHEGSDVVVVQLGVVRQIGIIL